MALGVAAGIVLVLGALRGIPDFVTFGTRSMQSECKAHLASLLAAEHAFFAKEHRFSTRIRDLGFGPDRGNRYAYRLGDGPLEDRSRREANASFEDVGVAVDTFRFRSDVALSRELPPTLAGARLGLVGTCPDCVLTVACVGQLDGDPAPDIWSVSTADRVAPDGLRIPAGRLFNDFNDAAFGWQP